MKLSEAERDARDLPMLARRDEGWTVAEIAKAAGVSKSWAFKLFREAK